MSNFEEEQKIVVTATRILKATQSERKALQKAHDQVLANPDRVQKKMIRSMRQLAERLAVEMSVLSKAPPLALQTNDERKLNENRLTYCSRVIAVINNSRTVALTLEADDQYGDELLSDHSNNLALTDETQNIIDQANLQLEALMSPSADTEQYTVEAQWPKDNENRQ
ncbi:hypothetical protein Q9Q94_10335 [Uliginosibacterium sp. 31-16]|uniref:hypothetical protein n=1 Tax=Uliginosibacterium sp. 31-16 TaxID=3068315 RepID=UPI00273F81E8|nr:hypothetical protein [Uliginosibacterium sp. 31-16]MDP5239933.1 hypothetical protein [Uliginosibacterium sp. 31-16]